MSFLELNAIAKSGRLLQTDFVWREGTTAWQAAGDLMTLFPRPPTPPPLLPGSTPTTSDKFTSPAIPLRRRNSLSRTTLVALLVPTLLLAVAVIAIKPRIFMAIGNSSPVDVRRSALALQDSAVDGPDGADDNLIKRTPEERQQLTSALRLVEIGMTKDDVLRVMGCDSDAHTPFTTVSYMLYWDTGPLGLVVRLERSGDQQSHHQVTMASNPDDGYYLSSPSK